VEQARSIRRPAGVFAAVTVAAVLLTGCPTVGGGGGSFGRTVNPCTPGSGITCDAVFGNIVAPPTIIASNTLAVVFNGAGAQPLAYTKLLGTLAGIGMHTIGLRYSSASGTADACPVANASTDPDCHRRFRGELTFGQNVADPNGYQADLVGMNVSQANSVMNRLLTLVEYLRTSYPSENWGQFQRRDSGGICSTTNTTYGVCELDWSKVVPVGHSLGAGVALYLSKFKAVDRLGMISGPFDEYVVGPTLTVAPWIAEGGFATPSSNMFGLTHTLEPNAAAQSAAWDALAMAGPQVSVDGNITPYGGAQQLTTSLTPSCNGLTGARHNSTAQDLCTPENALAAAWSTMAAG